MELLLEFLLSPGWVIGGCIGALVALGLHWLFPDASPVFGALAVAAAACTPKPPAPPPAATAAMQQLPPGRVYTFHSSAQSGCPGLDWHVVLTPDNMLDGMIAWNNWQSMAHATGSVNPQTRTFQMTAEEVGGRHRTADISGTVQTDGYLVANISGPNVNCQGIKVGWSVPPPPSQ